MQIKRIFNLILLLLTMGIGSLKAQSTSSANLSWVREARLHYSGVVSFGLYKPLSPQRLVGGQLQSGFIFPMFMTAVNLEYRQYFKDFEPSRRQTRSAFFYALKPYAYLYIGDDTNVDFQFAGAVGYEWRHRSGFFLRPAVEITLPIYGTEKGKEDYLNRARGVSLMNTMFTSIAIGLKW